MKYLKCFFVLNKVMNKFLLNGNNFMTQINLRPPGFFYSSFGPFTKINERVKKILIVKMAGIYYCAKLDKTFLKKKG